MRGKTAEEAQADTSLLSRRIFASPRPRRLVAPIAGISLLSAVFLTVPAFSWDTVVRNFLVVALPLYGSALLTLIVAKAQGRTETVIVMDDNVRPEDYWPCFQVIAARLP